jgi:hypothetical protein
MMHSDPKRAENRNLPPQSAIVDKTLTAFNRWKPWRLSQRVQKSPEPEPPQENQPPPPPKPSRLPTELYEQILASVGHDIPLLPPQLDRQRSPYHFRSYFQSVDLKVRARNRTLRNCRLVSSAWNEIASKHLNTYLVLRSYNWRDHVVWKNEIYRLQVKHVWILDTSPSGPMWPPPWNGLLSFVFTGFLNLETLYASIPGCYESFYTEHILRLHVPQSLRILCLESPIPRGPVNPIRGALQLSVLRLFPNLETVIELGRSSDNIVIVNGLIPDSICSTIEMTFSCSISTAYFSQLRSLSLTGGHIVQDDHISSLASLCPSVRSLSIRNFDRSFTMRGITLIFILTVGLELLLEKTGPHLESLQLAIRQSDQLWGDGTLHLCHILARTCNHLKYLSIGEEDSFNRPIRSTSCCQDLFDLAKWENLTDCYLCVYPGRGGCLDQSGGSLNSLVQSARAVALRNSLGTIIRIKGTRSISPQIYFS